MDHNPTAVGSGRKHEPQTPPLRIGGASGLNHIGRDDVCHMVQRFWAALFLCNVNVCWDQWKWGNQRAKNVNFGAAHQS
jgi:hypothetical protein